MSRPALDSAAIASIAAQLAGADCHLNKVYQRLGPPPVWKRPATFATLVRIILEQQVSLASARNTFARLSVACNGSVSAPAIIDLGDQSLRQIGFSSQKSRYAIALADDVVEKRLRVGSLRYASDEAVRAQLTSRLGLGNWSADVFLMTALSRDDVFPVGDLALMKGMMALDGGDYSTPEAMIARAERWRPYRSVAVRMIWQFYLDSRGQRA